MILVSLIVNAVWHMLLHYQIRNLSQVLQLGPQNLLNRPRGNLKPSNRASLHLHCSKRHRFRKIALLLHLEVFLVPNTCGEALVLLTGFFAMDFGEENS